MTLNPECRPFVASQILECTSTPVDIAPRALADSLSTDRRPVSTGLEHGWRMLLTPPAELEPAPGEAASISEALRTLTVELSWNGGRQTVQLPVSL